LFGAAVLAVALFLVKGAMTIRCFSWSFPMFHGVKRGSLLVESDML
jgi:hypothetical protein